MCFTTFPDPCNSLTFLPAFPILLLSPFTNLAPLTQIHTAAQVNLCFLFFDAKECVAHLGKVLAEKPDEQPGSGEVFDREAYLRETEGFDEVEVVVAGRNSVKVGGRSERAEKLFLHYCQR